MVVSLNEVGKAQGRADWKKGIKSKFHFGLFMFEMPSNHKLYPVYNWKCEFRFQRRDPELELKFWDYM